MKHDIAGKYMFALPTSESPVMQGKLSGSYTNLLPTTGRILASFGGHWRNTGLRKTLENK
jgi:hypothetical protein